MEIKNGFLRVDDGIAFGFATREEAVEALDEFMQA